MLLVVVSVATVSKISYTTLANIEALASGEGLGSTKVPAKQFMCAVMEGYKGCV